MHRSFPLLTLSVALASSRSCARFRPRGCMRRARRRLPDRAGFGPVEGADTTATFTLTMLLGECASSSSSTLSATGTITGSCGSATGVGTTNTGHNFIFVGVGPALAFTGEVTDVVSIANDGTSGSCSDGTAHPFYGRFGNERGVGIPDAAQGPCEFDGV